MTILLIIGFVFGMMCWVAWGNGQNWTITLTFVDPPIVLKKGYTVELEWDARQSIYLSYMLPIAIIDPTYSAEDDLELRIGIEGDGNDGTTNSNEGDGVGAELRGV